MLNKKIRDFFEEHDWKVTDFEDIIEIETYSEKGENLVEDLHYDGTTQGIQNLLKEMSECFVPDEHVKVLLGVNSYDESIPTVESLIDKADAVGNFLENGAISANALSNKIGKDSVITEENMEKVFGDKLNYQYDASEKVYDIFVEDKNESTFVVTVDENITLKNLTDVLQEMYENFDIDTYVKDALGVNEEYIVRGIPGLQALVYDAGKIKEMYEKLYKDFGESMERGDFVEAVCKNKLPSVDDYIKDVQPRQTEDVNKHPDNNIEH